jgi:surface carbohydrate biosynthesis protein
MKPGVLIVPCETQAREFDAKLLLSCFAAERGFRVIVGSKKQINKRISALPRSIFLSKSLTKRNRLTYALLDRMGHEVICGDEEALVYASVDSYLHHKVAEPTFRQAKALLAWGERNAEIWREYSGYHGAPIHVTGNARIDLLRPELRPLFTSAADELRARHGRFVLINTNFSRLNHYFPGQSRQRRALESPAATSDFEIGRGLAAHKAKLYEHFLEMVPAIARACPDHTIIVRPHPSEGHETWLDVARETRNVKVIHEGNVVPWLIASEVMLHNGCQTAVEAYLLDEPAISYQPATSENFDLQLPNLLSHRCFDLPSLVERVTAQLAGTADENPAERAKQDELIDQYIASRSGDFASERIAGVLEELASQPLRRVPIAPNALAHTVANAMGLLQRVQAYWPGSHNNRVFLRHMFPGATLADVESRITSYGRLLGRFSSIRARELHQNIFELERQSG